MLNLNYQNYNVLSLNCFIMLLHTPERKAAAPQRLAKRAFDVKERATGLDFFNKHNPNKVYKTADFLRARKLGMNDLPYSRICSAKPCWYKICFPKKTQETNCYCQTCKKYMHELCFIAYHANKFESCPWSFQEADFDDEC